MGVTGLIERMTLGRIMPAYFLRKNRRDRPYRIIILFLLLSVSILIITKDKVDTLAGVYTISFLAVMGLFGVGNILLKIRPLFVSSEFGPKALLLFGQKEE